MSSSPVEDLCDTLSAAVADVPAAVLSRDLVTGGERCGLVRALEAVPDPRDPRGVRYPLAGLLAAAVTAVITGAVTFSAMAERARGLPDPDLEALGLPGRPVLSTFWRALCRVDAAAVGTAVTTWLLARVAEAAAGDEPSAAGDQGGVGARGAGGDRAGADRAVAVASRMRVVAIDGKTVRGTCRGLGRGAGSDSAPTHVLSALDTRTGIVLARAVMDAKGGEIALFGPLARQCCQLLGHQQPGTQQPGREPVVFVADAQQTQKANLREVVALGAHLLVTAKANQPSLLKRLKSLPWAQVPVGDRTRDRAHGRRETRTCKVLTLDTPTGLGPGFTDATRAVRITRTRIIAGTTTRETAYLITTLPADLATAADINACARLEWHVENRLHWVKDVTLREDEQRARTGKGPAVFSVLREAAIGYHRQAGHTNIAHAIRTTHTIAPHVIKDLTST